MGGVWIEYNSFIWVNLERMKTKLYVNKEHFYTFRICPLLKIINKKSIETGIGESWLQYFWNTETENIGFKRILYNVKSITTCIMPPYYTIPNTSYIDLEKLAVKSNYEEAMNILKLTNDFILSDTNDK